MSLGAREAQQVVAPPSASESKSESESKSDLRLKSLNKTNVSSGSSRIELDGERDELALSYCSRLWLELSSSEAEELAGAHRAPLSCSAPLERLMATSSSLQLGSMRIGQAEPN